MKKLQASPIGIPSLHGHYVVLSTKLHLGDFSSEPLLSTQMALLRPSADIPYVGTQKDIYGLKVA